MEIQMALHNFSEFAYLQNYCECIAESNPSADWSRTRCLLIYQQTSASRTNVLVKTGFIWKFSREWPLNGVRKLRLTAKETSIAIFEVLVEKCPIAVQGIFVGIFIKASAASIQVTDLLFAFAFCKK